MSQRQQNKFEIEGEEADSGYASPALDLVATAFLVLVALGFMAASVALPIPGSLTTAPGLVPLLVATTLLLMAIGLGVSAFTRWRLNHYLWDIDIGDRATTLRTLFLGVAVAAYIAALQIFAYQSRFGLLGFEFRLTAFEPVSVVALSAIIHAFWRGPIWITVGVSAGWTVTLSLVFQKVFNIPLPGSF